VTIILVKKIIIFYINCRLCNKFSLVRIKEQKESFEVIAFYTVVIRIERHVVTPRASDIATCCYLIETDLVFKNNDV
jgi:hypothetical protein